jgi:tripartite-type tricarboxylate transporter receptor subunit TctC
MSVRAPSAAGEARIHAAQQAIFLAERRMFCRCPDDGRDVSSARNLSLLNGRGMTRSKVLAACAAVIAVLGAAATPAGADAVSDFYKGKSINLHIGFGPGGGYDVYARMLARHFGRFVPGNPTIVPQNMPGAGGLKSATFLYNAASRDGLALGMFGGFDGLEPLFGNAQASFDTVRFTWIGNMNRDVSSCAVWNAAGFGTFSDVMQREIVFGSSGKGSTTSQHALVLKNMLGAKVRVIEGYQGTNSINLAMKRREVDASCGIFLSSALTSYEQDLKSGDMRILIQFGRRNVPQFGDAVNLYDLLQADTEKQVADIIFRQSEIARPIAGPPGIPADRARALRTAFMQTMRDPAFLADAEKVGMPIDPMTGEEAADLFESFFATPKSIVERAKFVMNNNN